MTNGFTVRSVEALLTALGWNSVAVFEAGEHHHDGVLSVNKTTEVVALSDPYPEYEVFVFKDGSPMHTMTLMKSNHEAALGDRIENYGEAQIRPLTDCGFDIERTGNLPEYVGGVDAQ